MSPLDSSTCNLLFTSVFFDHNRDDGNGIQLSLILCIGMIILSFVVSSATGNYSQVDKAWSIIPPIYAWLVVCDERTLLQASLATLWGARLTRNFYRRGGYRWPPWTGDEDYRWNYLRQGSIIPFLKNPMIWIIFNLVFICIYQHFLLWLIVSPSFVSFLASSSCGKSPLNLLDFIATLMFLSGIAIESLADDQQYAFQTEKYRRIRQGLELIGEYKDGFKQSGLFAIVRKPNYAAEQWIWISYYLFSVAATKSEQIWNWSASGCILLCLLFQGSGWFTECITVSKYPKYKHYQKTTPMYFPLNLRPKAGTD